MSKLKTITCPFCSRRSTFKYGLNFVCSCGSRYYAKSGRWIEHIEKAGSDGVIAALEKMRAEMSERIDDFHRKMEDHNS